MSRDDMTEKLIADDINSIIQDFYKNDFSFLNNVLSGCGWVPYNQLTLKELEREYKEREFEDEQ